MSQDSDEWVTARAAMSRLGRSERQFRHYVSEKRIRTQKRRGQTLYSLADIDSLATSLPQDEPQQSPAEIIPAGQLLTQIERLQQQITDTAAREGYLAACRRELMKWGKSVTIRPTLSTIGAQEGFESHLRTQVGKKTVF